MTHQNPNTMRAVLLTGHGDFSKLEIRTDLPIPQPGAHEVLIKVAASSVNNTDINMRVGWYAKNESEDGGWTGQSLPFPLIQGIDIAGEIVGVGTDIGPLRVGERVIVQCCLTSLRKDGVSPFVGSERDGGFAQYVCMPAPDVHAITSDISYVELAAIPCAYGTAESMLTEAGLKESERVLITGASGNVGLAAIQLALLRRAEIHALASPSKHQALLALGVTACYPHDLTGLMGGTIQFDVVIDLVGGPNWNDLFARMKPFGRIVISGAIAGPMATIDLRTLYLNNLRIFGCTEQSRESFVRLVEWINAGKIAPIIHKAYPLEEIVAAQQEFLARNHIGKIVLEL